MPSIESKIVDVARNATFSHPLTRRSFFAAMGAAGITLGAVACGAGGSSTSTAAGGGAGAGKVQEKTLCQVTTLSNDYFVAFSDGGKQAMDALGVSMSSVEDQGNVNTALGQVGNVRASGGKSIFGTPATEAQAAAVTKACQAAGILYASSYTAPAWYTPADADKWVRFITPPSTKIAVATAKALFDKVGGNGTIIHVPGQKGSSSDDQRTAGLNAAAKDYPGIKIVTASPGNWTSEDARKAFTNILPSVPDFVGVFAQNDSQAAGVIAALDAAKITGKIVVGFDGNKQNVEYIAQGKQYLTSATVGGLTAGILGVTIFDQLNGVDLSLPERFLSQGALLVTPEIADDVLKTVYAPTLPFDWAKMSKALHPDDWDPQTVLNPIDPREYYAGVSQDQYTLNSAWNSADITGVRTEYAAAFRSGPLLQYKDQLVA
ncbi:MULTISPECIES: sugar ABC transporter substrate-binding protein [Rhodococcus]|uniref:sugar ABC transporter substrate-binding protein n=1 Tax=Rhodococcus TaxID=1827 RepID=UPI000A74DCAF|nr:MULTISPECIES: sugar ABC transporter substrate-binding protein [Rhodococcus]MBQ7805533.1 sugar ABC transporter substrate-binding protein [Rhodococcus sp. (in: high G+C Gram-positive bacteria)]MDF3317702.1 sugar ABC transporter substrate-binding protein [Rhodococcus sp. C3V]MDT9661668.1 sugar ABC transporter substrate-binding protein [Rhodococcus qingshengii]WEX06587.1 sugar ABC transporter substrate-binding protein [Rhodococcus sp. RCBS9]